MTSTVKIQVRQFSIRLKQGDALSEQELVLLREHMETCRCPDAIPDIMGCFRQINDPANAPWVEPYLYKRDVELAKQAIWVLCWLGQGERFRAYILEAVEPGFDWDPKRELPNRALRAAGLHLKDHRDRDLAQLLTRWAPRADNDPFYLYPPPGVPRWWRESVTHAAAIAMGYAVGADPWELTESDDLVEASVKTFMAERQDG